MPLNITRIRELAGMNESPVDDRPEDERLLDDQVAKERAFGIKLKQAMNGIDVFRGEQHSYNFYWSSREIEVLIPEIHSFAPGDISKLEELMGRPIKKITVSGEFSILFGF